MKIHEFVLSQAKCGLCVHGKMPCSWPGNEADGSGVDCALKGMSYWSEKTDTCGSWYLAITIPANPALIGDKPFTMIQVHDIASWLNLYQCPKPPQIRVLSRDEWPEVQ